MSAPRISPLRSAWYKWKALRLPWRKQFLVGLDLNGNTYWEFRDIRGTDPGARWRRIVKYPSKTHYGDVKVPPMWHQWLRQQRPDPPSIAEQQAEVARQERLKYLAAQADARWAAKPSLVDGPTHNAGLEQPKPPLTSPSMEVNTNQPPTTRAAQTEAQDSNETSEATTSREKTWEKMLKDEQQQQTTPKSDPWKQAQQYRGSGPSEEWQPKAWDPSAPKKK
ncbi:hypothetical protein V8F20_008470 [Naviculisporaceae sp. PSN 640]